MVAKKRTTLKSIAEELGISVSVVSRVLSGQAPKYGISKTTAQAVLNTARKRNFRPNQVARALRLAKTHTLGLVIPDISNMFFAGLALGAVGGVLALASGKQWTYSRAG